MKGGSFRSTPSRVRSAPHATGPFPWWSWRFSPTPTSSPRYCAICDSQPRRLPSRRPSRQPPPSGLTSRRKISPRSRMATTPGSPTPKGGTAGGSAPSGRRRKRAPRYRETAAFTRRPTDCRSASLPFPTAGRRSRSPKGGTAGAMGKLCPGGSVIPEFRGRNRPLPATNHERCFWRSAPWMLASFMVPRWVL